MSNMIEVDPDLRDIEATFRMLLSDMDEALIKDVTKKCMQTVAVYEYVLAQGKCENFWDTFESTLKSCNYNQDDSINPRDYVNSYTFKLKCIVTVQGIKRNNYETMEQAVYDVCSSEEYKELEKVIGEARDSLKKYKIKPNFSCNLFLPF